MSTTRSVFLEELNQLNNDVIKMGTLVEDSLEYMMKALKDIDVNMANVVIAKDDPIDDLEHNIEKECIALIAKQQPVASDLRKVISILKLVTDVERLADHCQDISEYVKLLAAKERIMPPSNLLDMADVMRSMALGVIECFVKKDLSTAKKIMSMDDMVDDYFLTIRDELTLKMQKNPDLVPQCVDYLMIIKYLERMADHSENIAEWVIYIITGELA